MITHDQPTAESISHRVIRLLDGKMVEDIKIKDIV
jgi:ABC-type dipeptide/oligopeptide/nickel transport system ATPase component